MNLLGGNSALWQGGLLVNRAAGASPPPDLPPVTGDDTATVTAGETVVISVLANDMDPEGGALSVTAANAAQGSVTVNPDNTVSYTAPSAFEGTATVIYTAKDPAGNTAQGTVTVTVTPAVVDAPPIAGDDAAEVVAGGSVTIDVLANDADPEGGALTVTSASADPGSAVVNSDNTVSYTAPQAFSGTATVIYTARDPAGNTAQGVITITVTSVQLFIDETTEFGNFAVEAGAGTISLTILEPAEYASEHEIQTVDLAAGPINLIPPRISGGTATGSTLTATPGVWACDEQHGALSFSQKWLRGTTPISGATGASYEIAAGDELTGLRYLRQVQNAAGGRSIEVEALAAEPETGSGFTENAVRFTSGSKLVRNADLAPADSHDVLFFASFLPFDTGRRGVLRQTGTYNGIEMWDGGVFRMFLTVGGYPVAVTSRPFTAGQRVNFLGLTRASGETETELQLFSRFEGETGWTSEETSIRAGLADLTFGGFSVGGKHGSGGHLLNAAVYRLACWSGTPVDPDDPGFFGRFLKADGTVEDPAVSRNLYGLPRVDLHGPAEEYASGINHGTAGNFDIVEGTFTNA